MPTHEELLELAAQHDVPVEADATDADIEAALADAGVDISTPEPAADPDADPNADPNADPDPAATELDVSASTDEPPLVDEATATEQRAAADVAVVSNVKQAVVHNSQLVELAEGQRVEGDLAVYLLATGADVTEAD